MLRMFTGDLRSTIERYSNLLIAVAFALSGVMPIILSNMASAGTLSSRRVTVASSQPAATGVNYSFAFSTTVTGAVQSMIFQFCNTPLGTCVLPGEAVAGVNNGTDDNTEIDVSAATASPGAWGGDVGTAFTEVSADTGQCTDADTGSQVATMYCVQRTAAGNENAGAKTFVVNGITNPTIPTGNNQEVYVRITTYSDTSFATSVDSGTVAASIVNQLTVTGRVQERLIFCVFALDDTAASNSTIGDADGEMPTRCSSTEANESTNVDIGVIDNLGIARSPVNNSPPSSLGNDRFGAAMINTNASSGVALTYYPTAATSGTEELRAFRVSGATCTNGGADLTDQCFRSAATTGTAFTAGSERFGMHIACVVNATNFTTPIGTTSNLGAGGTGTGSSGGTYNTSYSNTDDNIGDVANDDDCENSDAGVTFAWDTSGTAVPLIHSSTVVDDELVKLRFGATAEATTPTGTYTVATTYIATPTF